MALPTLRPYYITRNSKVQAEHRMARQAHESDIKQKWSQHSQYFRNSNIQSSKQEAWTSSKSFQNSMEAYSTKAKAEDKRRLLMERRAKLKVLLDNERDQLEQELREHTPDKMVSMKERATQLKSQREQERKKVAEEKLHEQWRINCPELRELDSQQLQHSVQGEWENQIQTRQQELESINREKQRYGIQLEEERLATLKLEEEERKRHRQEEREHAEMLRQQMTEIKQREEEAALIEQQQALLIQQQIELEKAEEERKKLKEVQRKTELGRLLLHQHKAQMKRKSRQIQEALELDMKILNNLAEKEKVDQMVQTARREKAKADVEWMKEVIVDQLRVEKEREAELDILYQEEVARMWRKREAEWEREKLARERLMAEVMAERQQQIDRKLDILKAQQAESIQRREDLLQEMESVSQLTARQSKEKEEERVKRAEELREQMSERKLRANQAKLQYEREIEAQRFAEEEYKALVQEEMERRTSTRLEPKIHAKKKYAWY